MQERIVELAPESARGRQCEEAVRECGRKHQRVEHAMNRQSLVVGCYNRVVLDEVHPRIAECLAEPHDDADRQQGESEIYVPLDDVQLALRQREAGWLRRRQPYSFNHHLSGHRVMQAAAVFVANQQVFAGLGKAVVEF